MDIYEIYEHLETAEGIASLLALDDFTPVYELADRVRAEHVGDTVHLRAIIEFSNVCKRQCIYCGLNRENRELERFRMSHDEIIEAAAEAVDAGYRTIVLQSGEDDGTSPEDIVEIIKDIKKLRIRDPWTFAESPPAAEGAAPVSGNIGKAPAPDQGSKGRGGAAVSPQTVGRTVEQTARRPRALRQTASVRHAGFKSKMPEDSESAGIRDGKRIHDRPAGPDA